MQPTNTKDPTAEKVLKFDMSSDEKSRKSARLGYEIAKKFKSAGIKFRRIIPAASDSGIVKMFKLAPTNDLMCLEINITNTTKEQQDLLVNDVKDHFLVLDNIKLIDEQPYKHDRAIMLYRFLFKYTPQG